MALVKPKNSAIVKIEPSDDPLFIKMSYVVNPSNRIQSFNELDTVTSKELRPPQYMDVMLSFLNQKSSGPASRTEYNVVKYVPVQNKLQTESIQVS